MSVVNHYREGLAAVDTFKSSRHMGKRVDAVRNGLIVATTRKARCCCGQNVVDIHAPDQWRKNGNLRVILRRYYVEPRAPRSNVNVLSVKIAALPAISAHHGVALAAAICQLRT